MNDQIEFTPLQEITTPEKAAMGKITDIHNKPFYKHSFPRFAYQDQTQTDRLALALRHGLISEDLASELGIPYPRNFKKLFEGKTRETVEVSLSSLDTTILDSLTWAGAAELTSGRPPIKDNLYTLLIDADIIVKKFPGSDETRFKRGLPSSKFKGLVIIGDQVPPQLHRAINIDFSENDTNKTLEEAVQVMHEAYRERPELVLPIYDIAGNLLWPNKLSYDDIKQLISERGNS